MFKKAVTYGLAAIILACSAIAKQRIEKDITIEEVTLTQLPDHELYELGFLEALEKRLEKKVPENYAVGNRDDIMNILRLARVRYDLAMRNASWGTYMQHAPESAEDLYGRLLKPRLIFYHTTTTLCSATLGGFSSYAHRTSLNEQANAIEKAAKEFLKQRGLCQEFHFDLLYKPEKLFSDENVK
ncbi:hypothetical protein HYY69_08640 [Candidatus Woesearchaeota archaeon]|nr:hypothetical protein [Candidatus Woesearchaeota archaeon]